MSYRLQANANINKNSLSLQRSVKTCNNILFNRKAHVNFSRKYINCRCNRDPFFTCVPIFLEFRSAKKGKVNICTNNAHSTSFIKAFNRTQFQGSFFVCLLISQFRMTFFLQTVLISSRYINELFIGVVNSFMTEAVIIQKPVH